MKNKFVVYTVITGGIDNLQQPLVKDSRFDYVLFTDIGTMRDAGVWQVRDIPYQHENARKRSRFPKLLPMNVLPDYEASLYIDGNIGITSQWVYDRCIDLFEQNVEWAGIKHQWRNSIKEEIDWMLKARWVHDYDVLNWYRLLMKDNYFSTNESTESFLYENNVIFRRHCENVRIVSNIWWWSVERFVSRDQFSLMFALWKVPEIHKDFFLPSDENVWNNAGYFHYYQHNPHHRVLQRSIWERIRHRCWRMEHNKEEPYTHLLDFVCSKNRPQMALHLWTFNAILNSGYKLLWGQIVRHANHRH